MAPTSEPPASASPVPVPTGGVRERLQDARLYLCTDARRDRRGGLDLLDLVRAALRGGVDVVQLRDRSLDVAEELDLLAALRELTIEHGALLAVNDRADVALAARADVLHTGQRDLPVAAARGLVGPNAVLGRSTGGGAQASAADADPDVDYFCVGPVWATPTKPGRPAVGLDAVRRVAAARPATPWFAIGGVDLGSVREVVEAGARRVVVVRAVTEAADPEGAARDLRATVARAVTADAVTAVAGTGTGRGRRP
ncbi:thiamine phosphate synthase [Sanguibacter sp. 25GB23B1]|uniref:thiamine phosphate synthase n=1 Tax=unclassified Sanguibacter TaxID=2645534 RepID=UPI0032AEB48A